MPTDSTDADERDDDAARLIPESWLTPDHQDSASELIEVYEF